ncbi:hypothetical protein CAQU_12085 [Corynebacterium aquilae DSM 44791]|uniref:Uncharacterized protein n=1 Tax=Corynebacterium aquilae DSM 44791 TaxID=1431546 RepID=A0A1L7CIG0_9CORY|nr:hypothetical protein CAQU_12085 [Corynebacterium aquilae DSM 44791]
MKIFWTQTPQSQSLQYRFTAIDYSEIDLLEDLISSVIQNSTDRALTLPTMTTRDMVIIAAADMTQHVSLRMENVREPKPSRCRDESQRISDSLPVDRYAPFTFSSNFEISARVFETTHSLEH